MVVTVMVVVAVVAEPPFLKLHFIVVADRGTQMGVKSASVAPLLSIIHCDLKLCPIEQLDKIEDLVQRL